MCRLHRRASITIRRATVNSQGPAEPRISCFAGGPPEPEHRLLDDDVLGPRMVSAGQLQHEPGQGGAVLAVRLLERGMGGHRTTGRLGIGTGPEVGTDLGLGGRRRLASSRRLGVGPRPAELLGDESLRFVPRRQRDLQRRAPSRPAGAAARGPGQPVPSPCVAWPGRRLAGTTSLPGWAHHCWPPTVPVPALPRLISSGRAWPARGGRDIGVGGGYDRTLMGAAAGGLA